jgi:hypothetical protein
MRLCRRRQSAPMQKFKVRLLHRSRLARGRRGARAHAGVPEIARSPHRPRARRASVSSPRRRRTAATGKAAGGPRAQRIGAAEECCLWVGACTHALREHTHRVCSSATNAVSAASYAVRPKGEYRRAPVAQRRASLCAAHAACPSPCKHSKLLALVPTCDQSVLKASRAAESVLSMSAAECAALTKPASYNAGARYTPRSSIAWKKRLKRSLSVAITVL